MNPIIEHQLKTLGIVMIMTFLFIAGIFAISVSAQSPSSNKDINLPYLSWEIKQSLGINCGGYFETDGTVQNCSLEYSELSGLTIKLRPEIEVYRANIEDIVSRHNPDNIPLDFPIQATPTPERTLQERYDSASTVEEKLDIIAESLGLK